MNPRQKLLAGYIADFFMDNQAPPWLIVGPALKQYEVKTLFGCEMLPDDFLKVVFASDKMLIKRVPEFVYRHHQITMLLLKEEYNLQSCTECGTYSRSLAYNWRRRFESFQEPDKDGWEDPTIETLLAAAAMEPIQESEDEVENHQKTCKEDDKEKPKLKKCCKEFNPIF